MWVLFTTALVATVYGMLQSDTATSAVAAAVLIVAWFGLMDEERVNRLGNFARLWLRLPGLRRALEGSSSDARRAQPLLRLFARRYPVYMRCPFRIDETGQVHVARSPAERSVPFTGDTAPAMCSDLRAILDEEGVRFPDIRILWLLVNRAVLDVARERVQKEVVQPADGDPEQVWRLFARFESARAAEWGGPALLHREALAELLRDQSDAVDWRHAHALTAWVDGGIERARRRALGARRKDRLRADLTSVDGSSQAVRPRPLAHDLTVDGLVRLAAGDMEGAARALAEVFGSLPADKADGRERFAEGWFVAEHADGMVVFQLGWAEQGSVPRSAVERALANKVRCGAATAVLLALAHVHADVVLLADEVGVLVLPSEALARMLDYHTDRMWQTIEWSLRASSKSNVEGNYTQGLELGLST